MGIQIHRRAALEVHRQAGWQVERKLLGLCREKIDVHVEVAAKIATEISAIDPDLKVNNIPGLLKRRAETDVNLRENETLVIAGLLSDDTGKAVDKVPGLGDIPILGRLFKSKDFQSRQTDLVVFITPRFVGPETDADRQLIQNAPQKIEAARERIKMAE